MHVQVDFIEMLVLVIVSTCVTCCMYCTFGTGSTTTKITLTAPLSDLLGFLDKSSQEKKFSHVVPAALKKGSS